MNSSMRPTQLRETVDLLIEADADASYTALKDARDEVVAALTASGSTNEFVLKAWLQADPVDWTTWHEALNRSIDPSQEEAQIAEMVLSRLFESWDSVGEAQAEEFSKFVASVVERASPVVDEDAVHPVVEVFETTLDPPDWARDGDSRMRRDHLHGGARKLRPLGANTWQRIEALLANDLRAGIERARAQASGVASAGHSMLEAVRGAEIMGEHLGDGALTHVLKDIPEFDPTTESDEASAEVSARSVLTKVAKDRNLSWKKPPFGISAKRVLAVAEGKGCDLDDAVSHWLLLSPKASEVASVAVPLLPGLTDSMRGALDQWAASVTAPQRTSLAKALLRYDQDASAWLRVLAAHGINEAGPVEIIRNQVVEGGSVDLRARAAREAQALTLQTRGAGQAISGAVTTLLRKSRARGDIGVAALLAAAVPAEAIKQAPWERAFQKRCDDKDYRLSREEAEALKSSGIQLPSEGLTKKMAKLFGFRS